MTRYKTRTGVVLTEICGEYLLVAAKALLDRCPYVTQVNESTAFVWKELKEGRTMEELLRAAVSEYGDDPGEIEASLGKIVKEMYGLGYLVTEETETGNHE